MEVNSSLEQQQKASRKKK